MLETVYEKKVAKLDVGGETVNVVVKVTKHEERKVLGFPDGKTKMSYKREFELSVILERANGSIYEFETLYRGKESPIELAERISVSLRKLFELFDDYLKNGHSNLFFVVSEREIPVEGVVLHE